MDDGGAPATPTASEPEHHRLCWCSRCMRKKLRRLSSRRRRRFSEEQAVETATPADPAPSI